MTDMPNSIKLTRRGLQREEAEIISKEIARTPNIVGYLPRELLKLDDAIIIESQAEIAGVLAYIEADKFIDLKLMLVREKYRGKGYASQLFHDFMKTVPNKPICTVTKNPAIVHLLQTAGFKKVTFWQLPPSFILHQSKMTFSLFRVKEYLRKAIAFPRSGKFTYWVKA